MKNKTDIQTKNQQIDKILQEQYDTETKILESALLNAAGKTSCCLLYTSPSPRDVEESRMPSSA